MKTQIRKFIPEWMLSAYHWSWAALATLVYRFPSEKLIVIGITGTDGKTTTANLAARLLETTGAKVGLATTINFRIGDREWENLTKQGMQGRFKNQQLLRRMVKAGCRYAVIETTSEGIKQYRNVGINYDVAVFTNLTPEHIEAHGSFEKYKQAKGKLFRQTARSCKVDTHKYSIINVDDANADYFLSFDCERNIIYGIDSAPREGLPYLRARALELSPTGTNFDIEYTEKGKAPEVRSLRSNLVGRFNVYNLLAVICIGISQGLTLDQIQDTIPKLQPVPGRMEIVNAGQPFTVIVDYAHAPNALKNVYETLRPFVAGKLWSILGSQGGGRDKRKRPRLGHLAGERADYVVVTNEDPYDEDPKKIIDDVFAGVIAKGKTENKNAWRILDRRRALEHVLNRAQPDDLVIVTGKGAEKIMMGPRGKRISWSDRAEIEKIIKAK
jgi:UDP-N-acetylmuramoyl-L-alanyl-D-glutamate--2,6-diaminopimelate ligase